MSIFDRRKYLVKSVREAPRVSHLSRLFPECVYTLLPQGRAREIELVLRKSLGWKAGDVVELDDVFVRSAAFPD